MPGFVQVFQGTCAFPSAACHTSPVKQSQCTLCSAAYGEQHVVATALSTYLQEWVLRHRSCDVLFSHTLVYNDDKITKQPSLERSCGPNLHGRGSLDEIV